MTISIKDVEQVANLARLSFTKQEKQDFAEKLTAIVGYIEKLNEVNVEGVEPTYHVLPLLNVLRKDEVQPSMEREKVLANAPDPQQGCFKVPKIME
ncbi:aspartyl/glutamyl-tRNA(Asn/Gln) amidotransferase subunit C [Geosporobacter subterraneus DSM 17957]|uniref:Aspartyl/glutamyl-tRNA(Asn/Gln) amidotransferase subunit C n=1 Tax=Geosporobacter subterraneus DSM 17957 TaxID=1121919 RepID=A0A1M6EQY7_9FIRM|nr:Asp-tRNA(Asn)/Glu-tRNA(Gln) amidotransferase subunit GatC [Geosporobacter subterraneus]SHI87904.1 aspartyl/glutamyl-tRNA(Asn/Gln) amidotransferase subunit C [Geosporobacter subterraneus DSM 17957]